MNITQLKTDIDTMISSYRLGVYTPKEIFMHRLLKLRYGMEKAQIIRAEKKYLKLKKKYLNDDVWNFNGVKLPAYSPEFSMPRALYGIFMDTLFVYCNFNDNYDFKLVDKLDLCLPEGTYGYIKDNFDVTVKKDDVVLDCGAWIGDFSAYAAHKGAQAYAFEPSKQTIEYLKITQKLNGNIHIVEKGLSDKTETSYLEHNNLNTGGNFISSSESETAEKIEITTIDDFVAENNLKKVDFIKADIEGFERYMLKGATKTLKTFAPKLAICTYHLPDDPETLAKIILEANPAYTIIQKKKKLYAAVIE
ncbi:MAG: FkbM family methyltransferase [Paludibacter sp.]|nr:FkbM family methyltransferase [Paludibacter sp.]